MSTPVKLRGRLTVIEAHILQDALAKEGILAAIRHDHLASADLPSPGTEVELWVNELQLERAQKVVADAQDAVKNAETRICPNCGEDNPGNFERCWSCQALLQDDDEGGSVPEA